LEERLVEAASGSQLHAAYGAGNDDDRGSGKAEGRGIAQQARRVLLWSAFAARRATGRKEHEKLVLGEEVIDERVEGGVTLAIYGDFRRRDARARLQPLADVGWICSKWLAWRRAASQA